MKSRIEKKNEKEKNRQRRDSNTRGKIPLT